MRIASHVSVGPALRWPALIVPILLLTSCDLPKDPEGTLERVRDGRLAVGVSEAPPWITRNGNGEPGGIEAALVRHLAERLGADVRWVWGTPADHVEALERFQLDLVVGGHTRRSPLARPVAPTRTWYVSTERREETRVSKQDHVFLVPPGENGWLHWLDHRLTADSLLIRSLTEGANS